MVFTTLATPAEVFFSNLVSISQVRLNEFEELTRILLNCGYSGAARRNIPLFCKSFAVYPLSAFHHYSPHQVHIIIYLNN